MMRSYNLRGTNGSGKTFVARELIRLSGASPCLHVGRKVRAYQGLFDGRPIFFLGSYETQCGGCDTIPSVAETAGYLEHFMKLEHDGIVFFEGLMISHMLGTVGAMQTKLGKDRNVLAFLDTPLEICVQRVKDRRAERGETKEFDPRNVIADWPRVQSCKEKAIRDGYKVVTVAYHSALQGVRDDLTLLVHGDL